MRVLITTKKPHVKGFLVRLFCERSIKEVRDLITKEQNLEAMMLALRKGSFEQEVSESDMPQIHANLILSETNAMWDLMQ